MTAVSIKWENLDTNTVTQDERYVKMKAKIRVLHLQVQRGMKQVLH